jgi:hypothetical protein
VLDLQPGALGQRVPSAPHGPHVAPVERLGARLHKQLLDAHAVQLHDKGGEAGGGSSLLSLGRQRRADRDDVEAVQGADLLGDVLLLGLVHLVPVQLLGAPATAQAEHDLAGIVVGRRLEHRGGQHVVAAVRVLEERLVRVRPSPGRLTKAMQHHASVERHRDRRSACAAAPSPPTAARPPLRARADPGFCGVIGHHHGVAAPASLDPTTAILSGIAAHQCALFERHNLRIRRSKVIHAVRTYPWLAGLELPGPACDQGWGGPGLSGDLHPVAEPVTCQRCLRWPQARAAARLVAVPGGQLALSLEDLEPGQVEFDLGLCRDG